MEISTTELIGYAASLFVLLSFLMKKITVLRVVNSVGCTFFIIYGLMIPSYPIVFTNAAIVLVNAYYLISGMNSTNVEKDDLIDAQK
ncbi:MAG: hypothetical protein RL264_788 [Bacteroidota bacterium]|jgi:uncharacterized protein with PQ loop repeat